MDSAIIIGRAAAQQEVQQNAVLRRSNNWQDACDEIRADMGRRRRWLSRRRKVMLAAVVLVPAYVGAGSWWLMKSGYVPLLSQRAGQWISAQAQHAGFALRQVQIEGIHQLNAQQVMQASGLQLDAPMLDLSLHRVHDALAALPQVREVKLRRQFPDTLFITIAEREKAALWMNAGKAQWIDRDGTVLSEPVQENDQNAFHVMGADAPQHLAALLEKLEAYPTLAGKLSSARRVGARRWDLVMKGGLLVKLPQEKMHDAVVRLAKLYDEGQLSGRNIKMLDLRFEDRIFVLPTETTPVGAGGRTMVPPLVPAPLAPTHGGSHDA